MHSGLIGVDPGTGSPFGFCAMQISNNKVQVLYSEDFHRPDFNVMQDRLYDLYRTVNADKVVIDGSQADHIIHSKQR